MLADDDLVDRVRDFFHGKHRKGIRVVPAGALRAQLQKATGQRSAAVLCDALKRLKGEDVITCDFGPGWPVGQVTISAPPERDLCPLEQTWRQIVNDRVTPDVDRAAYYAIFPTIKDWPEDRFGALITTLEDIRRHDRLPSLSPLASAQAPLASAKLLDGLPDPALRALGVNRAAMAWLPTYIMLAGATNPEAVVLVENPAAFERAFMATRDLPVAWVCAFGFALSGAETAGERLVDGIAEPGGVACVVRDGAPPALPDLLSNPNLFHWGDLDLAGLQIFHRLRSRVPHLRLSNLMQPMIQLLRHGGGHPYTTLTGKPNQRPWRSGDPDLDDLIALCAKLAADQEFVTAEEIRDRCLGAMPL